MITSIITTILASIVGLMVYVYFHFNGQFEEQEDVRYQIFRDE